MKDEKDTEEDLFSRVFLQGSFPLFFPTVNQFFESLFSAKNWRCAQFLLPFAKQQQEQH